MRLVQCKFQHSDGPELTTQVAWVDASWHLHPGQYVMFRKDPRQWKVVEVYSIKLDVFDIHNTWTVGGNEEITARKESHIIGAKDYKDTETA